MSTDERPIRCVGVVGAGVIGSGWAARCLAKGLDVVATDPAPGAERVIRAHVASAWPALEKTGLADGADPARLRFEPDLAAAVSQADFVQENAPEDETIKRQVFAAIDAAAPADVIIASSSSGLLPTRIQSECSQPGRVLIGHPFNPVYLLPLVELVAGDGTDAVTIERAARFYRSLGMRPLTVRKEIAGYVSDRMQEALFREAMHIIAEGAATTEEIDAAITDGPGMRLAFMGPMMSFHLGAGPGGIGYHFEHFGVDQPWTHCPAPALSDDLKGRMSTGAAAQQGDRSYEDLIEWRDRYLLEVLALKKNLNPDY